MSPLSRIAWLWLALLADLPAAHATPQNLPTAAPVQFVILGDSGTGKAGQLAVAAAMADVCKQRGCQFALDSGDNIYENGVRSVDDPQFQTKFEQPYAALPFPFFLALGNHDQSGTIPGGGIRPENGNYEVAYSRKSTKWVMPHRYYQFAVPFGSPTDVRARVAHPIAELFAIDTNPVAPQDPPVEDWYLPDQAYEVGQRQWLRAGLADSNAVWKIVFGHHPLRNNGAHGNAGEFFGFGLAKGKKLAELYQSVVCGNADLLVSGHDHSLQWLAPSPQCGDRPEFIVSGAGAKKYHHRADPEHESNLAFWEAFDTLGFFWAEATADHLTLAAYRVDEKGVPTLAFTRTLHKPNAP